jgi:hypothetical protein
LLEDTPDPTGDDRWDVLFAGLAEHLAMRDGQAAPGWSAEIRRHPECSTTQAFASSLLRLNTFSR